MNRKFKKALVGGTVASLQSYLGLRNINLSNYVYFDAFMFLVAQPFNDDGLSLIGNQPLDGSIRPATNVPINRIELERMCIIYKCCNYSKEQLIAVVCESIKYNNKAALMFLLTICPQLKRGIGAFLHNAINKDRVAILCLLLALVDNTSCLLALVDGASYLLALVGDASCWLDVGQLTHAAILFNNLTTLAALSAVGLATQVTYPIDSVYYVRCEQWFRILTDAVNSECKQLVINQKVEIHNAKLTWRQYITELYNLQHPSSYVTLLPRDIIDHYLLPMLGAPKLINI